MDCLREVGFDVARGLGQASRVWTVVMGFLQHSSVTNVFNILIYDLSLALGQLSPMERFGVSIRRIQGG